MQPRLNHQLRPNVKTDPVTTSRLLYRRPSKSHRPRGSSVTCRSKVFLSTASVEVRDWGARRDGERADFAQHCYPTISTAGGALRKRNWRSSVEK